MNCPVCQKELNPVTDAEGVTRAFCDCVGFRRPVIEILPPAGKPQSKIINQKSKLELP